MRVTLCLGVSKQVTNCRCDLTTFNLRSNTCTSLSTSTSCEEPGLLWLLRVRSGKKRKHNLSMLRIQFSYIGQLEEDKLTTNPIKIYMKKITGFNKTLIYYLRLWFNLFVSICSNASSQSQTFKREVLVIVIFNWKIFIQISLLFTGIPCRVILFKTQLPIWIWCFVTYWILANDQNFS